MSRANTQPPRGMRDFLPDDIRKREYVIGVIKEVYERYGFEPLETPAAENIETLLGKYGEEGNQLIFKILKRGVHASTGEADLALRYDLTVPLARVVAEYRDKLPKFFKRYQIQPVWRADRPARGRFREFYQCDVDVIGSRSMIVEAELIAAVSDVFESLEFNDFTIWLNHKKVLVGLLEGFDIPVERQSEALVTLDKWDKIGRAGVVSELMDRGYTSASIDGLVTFIHKETEHRNLFQNLEIYEWEEFAEARNKHNLQVLVHLRQFPSESEDFHQGISELERLIALAQSVEKPRVEINLSLARGLSYYTGPIMEVGVPHLAGSLGGGGRYDNLIGMFSGQNVPACGFSLGLERIIVVMTERQMFPNALLASPADVMVTIWDKESSADSVKLAGELRTAGLRVDLYPEAEKLGKQFKYAAERGIPFVAIIGEDERARGEVSLKDMHSSEQRSIKRDNVAQELLVSIHK